MAVMRKLIFTAHNVSYSVTSYLLLLFSTTKVSLGTYSLFYKWSSGGMKIWNHWPKPVSLRQSWSSNKAGCGQAPAPPVPGSLFSKSLWESDMEPGLRTAYYTKFYKYFTFNITPICDFLFCFVLLEIWTSFFPGKYRFSLPREVRLWRPCMGRAGKRKVTRLINRMMTVLKPDPTQPRMNHWKCPCWILILKKWEKASKWDVNHSTNLLI